MHSIDFPKNSYILYQLSFEERKYLKLQNSFLCVIPDPDPGSRKLISEKGLDPRLLGDDKQMRFVIPK